MKTLVKGSSIVTEIETRDGEKQLRNPTRAQITIYDPVGTVVVNQESFTQNSKTGYLTHVYNSLLSSLPGAYTAELKITRGSRTYGIHKFVSFILKDIDINVDEVFDYFGLRDENGVLKYLSISPVAPGTNTDVIISTTPPFDFFLTPNAIIAPIYDYVILRDEIGALKYVRFWSYEALSVESTPPPGVGYDGGVELLMRGRDRVTYAFKVTSYESYTVTPV